MPTNIEKRGSMVGDMLQLVASIGSRGHMPKESRKDLDELWKRVMALRSLNLSVVRHYIEESNLAINGVLARGHLPTPTKYELNATNGLLTLVDRHFESNGIEVMGKAVPLLAERPHIGWYCRECHDHLCVTIYSGKGKEDYLPIRPTMCRFAGIDVARVRIGALFGIDQKVKWVKYHGEPFEIAPEAVVPKTKVNR